MRDIWNPWHGCRKVSEGCAHCYVYYQDAQRGGDAERLVAEFEQGLPREGASQ